MPDVAIYEDGFIGRHNHTLIRSLPQKIEFRTKSSQLHWRQRARQPLLEPRHNWFGCLGDMYVEPAATQFLRNLISMKICQFSHNRLQYIPEPVRIFHDLNV